MSERVYTHRRRRTDAMRRPSVKSDYFTGKVRLDPVLSTKKRPLTNVYSVKFYAGARTKMHRHTGGQILVVTAGRGSLITYKKTGSRITRVQRTSLIPGKIVHIPPGQLHTHGSVSKSKTFTHIAVNLATVSGGEMKTAWFDSDYASYLTRLS